MHSTLKKLLFPLLALTAVVLMTTTGCADDDNPAPGPYEPITFLEPDTVWLSALPSEVIPITVELTVDRPIDTLTAEFDVDTTSRGFFNAATATQFVRTGFIDTTLNVQTWSGQYTVPHIDSIAGGYTIRLRFTLEAQDLTYNKQVRVDVR